MVGEQYIYSGNRYSLLQEIIEQAGGAPFEELLRERIIEPASMQWHDSPRMGSSWGLVSTVEDLSRFAQTIQGVPVMWSYGQGVERWSQSIES